MQGFLQQNNSLIWTLNHETVRIEPWGRDSLPVREPSVQAFAMTC